MLFLKATTQAQIPLLFRKFHGGMVQGNSQATELLGVQVTSSPSSQAGTAATSAAVPVPCMSPPRANQPMLAQEGPTPVSQLDLSSPSVPELV